MKHVMLLSDGSEMTIEPVDPSLTPEEAMRKAIDDCPHCQAERAFRAAANRAANAARPEPERPRNWWHGRRTRRG